MATVTYAYAIGTEVYHMDPVKGVREAVVRALSINVAQAGTTLTYDIAFSKPTEGSALVQEPSLFADVDAALLAYRPTVIVP